MAKKCKYAKTGKMFLGGITSCYCTSPANPNTSKGNPDTRRNGEGYPVTGYIDGSKWWDLCMEGKANNGVTPSKCDYYR